MNDIELLTCSCCGRGLYNTPEQNADFDRQESHDNGFGMCRECGGAATNETKLSDLVNKTDKQIEKLIGWASWTFYSSRFDVLRKNLSDSNSVKFDGLPTWNKIYVVQKMIEKCHII